MRVLMMNLSCCCSLLACLGWHFPVCCRKRSWFAKLTLSRWEYITTIDFEWDYVAAKRKFKWPLLVRLVVLIMRRTVVLMCCVKLYSTCRICALGSTICFLIGVDVTRKIDCQVRSIPDGLLPY